MSRLLNDAASGHSDSLIVAGCLATHAFLVTWVSWVASPNCDELAHLASGLYHWHTGKFDSYQVNPPLVRLWATIPLLPFFQSTDWHVLTSSSRAEWQLAHRLMQLCEDEELRWALLAARLWCLPFSSLGAIVCFLWSRDRYDRSAGIAALAMWTFSPNVIAWNATVCPDLPAAALGVTYCRQMSCYVARGNPFDILGLGIGLGLVLLSKSTWIILILIVPALLLLLPSHRLFRRIMSAVTVPIVALLAVNAGYGFQGSFVDIDDIKWNSSIGRLVHDVCSKADGAIPSPLPCDYVEGLDKQRHDFERGRRSYLFGQWKTGGWWYYYAVASCLKSPLALTLMTVLALVLRPPGQLSTSDRIDSMCLLVAPIAVFLLVSSQTGFSRHLRYVALCFPFAFIWSSQAIGQLFAMRLSLPAYSLLTWYMVSSVSCAPLFHSHFNELVGGPCGGSDYLLDSNVDWGEDTWLAKGWAVRHPSARPLFHAFVDDQFATQIEAPWQRAERFDAGWFLVSRHRVMDPLDPSSSLRKETPIDRIGYSLLVYYLCPVVKPSDRMNRAEPVATSILSD